MKAPMSSREKPKAICVRSLVPKEKNSASSAILSGPQRGARDLDHRADSVRDASSRLNFAATSAWTFSTSAAWCLSSRSRRR